MGQGPSEDGIHHVRAAACDDGPGVPLPAAAAAVAGDWQALIPGHVRRGVTHSRSQAGWADVAILSEVVFAAQCRLEQAGSWEQTHHVLM